MFNPINKPPQRFGPNPKRRDGNTCQFGASERVVFAIIESDD